MCLYRPFRRVTDKGMLLWDRIHHLEKGQIYKQVLCALWAEPNNGRQLMYVLPVPLLSYTFRSLKYSIGALSWLICVFFRFCELLCAFLCFQGNLYEFLRLTGWRGSKVLYFGDHIYSDLAVSNSCTQTNYASTHTRTRHKGWENISIKCLWVSMFILLKFACNRNNIVLI